MPLPPATSRKHLHTRRIECKGYRRDDGLWDIEGTLVDTKKYDFPSHFRGNVRAGNPVHEMSVRLTVDLDLVIHEAVGCMDHTPYPVCCNAEFMVAKLKGLKIGPGWTRRAHKLMGGRRGCTHLFELLRPIATTCFQTMSDSRLKWDKGYTTQVSASEKRPFFINSCHALVANSEIVKLLWPEFYENRPDSD